MNILKTIALLNIIGFIILTLTLYISISLDPFPWDIMLILANIQIGLPFVAFGLITLRNLKQPNVRAVKIGFFLCYLFVWGPSVSLPFASLYGGIAVSASLLLLGIYGAFYLKDPKRKMLLFNWLGILFLTIDMLGISLLLIANQ